MPSKNSVTGPQAAVTEQNLLSLLPQEVAAYESQVPQTQQVTRDALRTALDTWGKIYHTLVWLAAAKDPPGPNELIFLDAAGNPEILLDSHIVPAFTGSEAGSSSTVLSGYIFGLQARFNDDKDDEFGGILFQDEAYQDYAIDNSTQPLLQHFLDKFRARRDALGFDLAVFNPGDRNQYRHQLPDPDIFFHPNTAEFVDEALFLIQALWGNNIIEELGIVNGWVNGDPNAGSRTWLDAQFGIDQLNIGGLFAGNNVASRQVLNNAKLAFSLNREIFGFVYDRFVDLDDGSMKSDGLEQVITILTSQLTDPAHLQVWDYLITATYGAVAMRIFRQTESLINLAKGIL